MHSLLSTNATAGLLQSNYRAQGQAALNQRQAAVQQIISQRQLPAQGWSSLLIQSFLSDIAAMDSNNFAESVGVGEREGRVHSDLVRQRHMQLSHGIGRSGDLLAQQPKAVGSSLLHSLTHALTLHAVRLAGLVEAKQVLLLPVATGMSIVLTLLALKQNHPAYVKQQKEATAYAQSIAAMAAAAAASASSAAAGLAVPLALPSPPPASVAPSFVIWSRIDQKTCLKSILAAGCVPLVVELLADPSGQTDELVTDVAAIERLLQQLGSAHVVAVVSTSSCFAPRAPDRVVEVSRLCAKYGVAHVVNHAYGLQCAQTNRELTRAVRKGGRIDALIASMDKNFMVPVGGAIVVGFHADSNAPAADAKKQKQEAMHQAAKAKQRAAAAAAAAAGAADAQPVENGGSAASAAASSSVAAASAGSIVPSASASASAAPASSASSAAAAPAAAAPSPAPLPDVLHLISCLYPGRASATPMIDLFLTLVSLGVAGWTQTLRQREELVPVLRAKLGELAASKGERMLRTPSNSISMAMTLDRLEPEDVQQLNAESVADAAAAASAAAAPAPGMVSSSSSSSLSSASTHAPSVPSAGSSGGSSSSAARPFVPSYLGSLLFSRHVSGPRVLGRSPQASSIGGIRFEGYGTHSGGSGGGGKTAGVSTAYPHAYVTAACSVGMRAEEIELFVARLDKAMSEFQKQKDKQMQQQQQQQAAAGRAASASTSSNSNHKGASTVSPSASGSAPQS